MATTALSRSLGVQYAHVAPDNLVWAQEREFFQLQVQRVGDSSKSVQAAIVNNVEATIESFRSAARACAAMGLTMNPIAQLVYFIPRRERKFNEELDKSKADYESKVPWIVTATPSYRGLAWIATHYAGADDVAAEVVFKADRFVLHGPFALPDHEPTIDNAQRKHELAIGVYCGIRWPGGRARSEYIDAPTIQLIRERSDLQFSLMWDPKKLWTEGWKKAVVRRACKLSIQGNPRMDAAEGALIEGEGVLIDHNIPRGTPPPAAAAPAEGDAPEGSKSEKPRGMAGVRAGLDAAKTKRDTLQEGEAVAAAAVEAQEPRAADPPPKAATPPSAPGPQNGSAGKPVSGDAFPGVPSPHPRGSIEWWADQINAADTRTDLLRVRDHATAANVDRSDDAQAFSEIYRKRSQALRSREPIKPQGGLL